MSASVHVVPHDETEPGVRYLYAAPVIAALAYPVALLAFYGGGRLVHDADTWEKAASAWGRDRWRRDPRLWRSGRGLRGHLCPWPEADTELCGGSGAMDRSSGLRQSAAVHGRGRRPLPAPFQQRPHRLGADLDADRRCPIAGGTGRQTTFLDAEGGAGSPPWLRAAHGLSALAILLVFLAPHMANHLTAIWSADLHEAVMNALRTIYRADFVQAALVCLFLFQITGGVALLARRVARRNDLFGSLQTASGAYLAAFVASHLTAVFVLGRLAMHVDTNRDFAIGAPAGLMGDPWNVRLVPHYSLAVLLLFIHLACGLRVVLLGQDVAEKVANRIAAAVIILGGMVALTIISAMLGVHAVAR
jgi:hypothetical protein